MSGYASMREVREVIVDTLRMEGRDPGHYSIAGIARDAFTPYQGIYGYHALDEQAWRDAVWNNRRRGCAV